MGRWAQYDDDTCRVPDGMQRIGYDSDTHRYTFRDGQGALWQGGEYGGELRQVAGPPGSNNDRDDEPIRVRPDAPIPTPGAGHTRGSSSLSTFQDFLPAGKMVAAAATDTGKSSPSPSPSSSTAKSPTRAKSVTMSKWQLLRSKSTSAAAVPKMQAFVHAALSHSKTDPGAAKGKYRPLDGRSSRK